jgi:hypothetical protein
MHFTTSRLMHACRTGLVGLSAQLLSVLAEPARAGDDQERIYSSSGTLGRYLFRRKIMSQVVMGQTYRFQMATLGISTEAYCWNNLVIAYNIGSSRLTRFFIDMFPQAGSSKVCSRQSLVASWGFAASKLLLTPYLAANSVPSIRYLCTQQLRRKTLTRTLHSSALLSAIANPVVVSQDPEGNMPLTRCDHRLQSVVSCSPRHQ